MARVLVVDDDRTVRHIVSTALEEGGMTALTAESATAALELIERDRPDVAVLDIVLPDRSGLEIFGDIRSADSRLPVIFMTAEGTSDTAIEAMKLGAFDYLLKPLDLPRLRAVVEQAAEVRRLMTVEVGVGDTLTPEDKGDQIVGKSAAMQEVFKAIGRVAPQAVSVLIRGESGTGKELVARAIYQHSRRAEASFLAVNCAAIPENLLESELFGHEKGAFTGADRLRLGKFEQCSGGTLFLDEVGDMPPSLQSKMLRVLQDGTLQRVGGEETISTDVRVISATNRNLERMVESGGFREDLLYRLNGFTIQLPALRDRSDDLVLLLEHFLARIGRQLETAVEAVTPEALAALRAYGWPGNVRELEQVVRHALLQATGTVLTPHALPAVILRQSTGEGHGQDTSSTARDAGLPHDLRTFVEARLEARSESVYSETLEMMERYLLCTVLALTAGNQSEASRVLGITRGSLRNKIRSLGISIDQVVEPGGDGG